jgi:hypothetical protein
VRLARTLYRQSKRHAQAGHTLCEEGAEASVAAFGSAKASILQKRPHTSMVHGGIDPARKGKFTRIAEVAFVPEGLGVRGGGEWRYLHAPGRMYRCQWPHSHAALLEGVRRLMGLGIGLVLHGFSFMRTHQSDGRVEVLPYPLLPGLFRARRSTPRGYRPARYASTQGGTASDACGALQEVCSPDARTKKGPVAFLSTAAGYSWGAWPPKCV